jgi:phosphohistidine phosphatase
MNPAAAMSRRLTLMRHGQAEWRSGEAGDFSRALNRRGLAEAADVLKRYADLPLQPDLIITSPAQRALQTAELAARALGLSAHQLLRDEKLYLAEPEDILQVVRATGPRIAHLMLVGHNPGITEFARQLAPADALPTFETGATCSMFVDIGNWNELRENVGREARYATAKRFLGFWR